MDTTFNISKHPHKDGEAWSVPFAEYDVEWDIISLNILNPIWSFLSESETTRTIIGTIIHEELHALITKTLGRGKYDSFIDPIDEHYAINKIDIHLGYASQTPDRIKLREVWYGCCDSDCQMEYYKYIARIISGEVEQEEGP